MFDLIARLRKRSPEHRRRIAFWIALCITLLIVFLWALSLLFGGFEARTTPSSTKTTPAEGLWLQTKAGIRAFINSVRR